MLKLGNFFSHMDFFFSYCRFLLGKHKAAIEFYVEASRLNEKDWVNEKKHFHAECLLFLLSQ